MGFLTAVIESMFLNNTDVANYPRLHVFLNWFIAPIFKTISFIFKVIKRLLLIAVIIAVIVGIIAAFIASPIVSLLVLIVVILLYGSS